MSTTPTQTTTKTDSDKPVNRTASSTWTAIPQSGILLWQNRRHPTMMVRIIDEQKTLLARVSPWDLFEAIDFESLSGYAQKKWDSANSDLGDQALRAHEAEEALAKARQLEKDDGISSEDAEYHFRVTAPRGAMAEALDKAHEAECKMAKWAGIRDACSSMVKAFNAPVYEYPAKDGED